MKKFEIGEKALLKNVEVEVMGLDPGLGYSNEYARIKNANGRDYIVHQSELSSVKKSAPKPKKAKAAPPVAEEEILNEPVVAEKPKKKAAPKKKAPAKKKSE